MEKEKFITMWIYPWDIVDEGVDNVLNIFHDEFDLDSISIATTYHSGKFLLPHNPQKRVYFPEPGATYFKPCLSRYSNLKIKPILSSFANEKDHLSIIREKCANKNIKYSSWVVGFHNSGIGWKHPDCCVHNAFNDPYYYALCPANPNCQEYLFTLVTDILDQFSPYQLELESPGYLGYIHRMHHERTTTFYGEFETILLSLCFCDDCKKRAVQDGIDINQLQIWIQKYLNCRLNEDWYTNQHETKNIEDLYSFLLHNTDLLKFIQCRQRVTSQIIEEIKKICCKKKTRLLPFASIFTRPSNRAWIEGTDLAAWSHLSDGVIILTYYSNLSDIFNDLNYAALLVEDNEKIMAGFSMLPPASMEKSKFLNGIQIAKEFGINEFGIYNYGLSSKYRLPWIKEAVKLIRQ